MFLPLLLIFLKTLDDIDLRDTNADNELQTNVRFKEVPSNHDMSQTDQLPALVPLEFPAELHETGAVNVRGVVVKKLERIFGETMMREIMKLGSSDGLFDFLSKADFHNSWINSAANNVGKILKSKESPLTSISSRKQCRRACCKERSSIMTYLQTSIQNVLSSLTNKDFRFEFSQNPEKTYTYELDTDTNRYRCKCTEEGYILKVSPTLKKLIEKKFLNKDEPPIPPSKVIFEEDPTKNVSHQGGIWSWKKITNIGLYVTGWKSRANRDIDDSLKDFIVYHGRIAFLLFIYYHPLFYLYIFHIIMSYVDNFYH